MPFIKLDTAILESTLWVERECRELFITALLLAGPHEVKDPLPAIQVTSLDPSGFVVPPGWYGFVQAAGIGIINRAGVAHNLGMIALERLGLPDLGSRSTEFEGRRMVRVEGGFIVLNFMKYRDRDYTSAERARRYRDRQASRRNVTANERDVTPNGRASPIKTQAEAEAEAVNPPLQPQTAAVEVPPPSADPVDNSGNDQAAKIKPKGKPKAALTKCPENFAPNEATIASLSAEGYGPYLDAHFAFLMDYAKTKGALYVDWQAAFRNSVRADWGKVRQQAQIAARVGAPVAGVRPWYSTWSSIVEKAAEYGLKSDAYDNPQHFKSAVFEKAREHGIKVPD